MLLCDEKAAPNGAVGAPAGDGDEVWGPGGVGDHSCGPWVDVWTQGRLLGALGRGWDEVVAPNLAVGAPAGAGVEVWGPGGVRDHSGGPLDDVWTRGRFVCEFGRGSR